MRINKYLHCIHSPLLLLSHVFLKLVEDTLDRGFLPSVTTEHSNLASLPPYSLSIIFVRLGKLFAASNCNHIIKQFVSTWLVEL